MFKQKQTSPSSSTSESAPEVIDTEKQNEEDLAKIEEDNKCEIPPNLCVTNSTSVGFTTSRLYCAPSEVVKECLTNEVCGYFPENTINPTNGTDLNASLKDPEDTTVPPCGYPKGWNIVRVKKGGSKTFNGFQCLTTDEKAKIQDPNDESVTFEQQPIFIFNDLNTCIQSIETNVEPYNCRVCLDSSEPVDCSKVCNDPTIPTTTEENSNPGEKTGNCAFTDAVSEINSTDPQNSNCCFCFDKGNNGGLKLGRWVNKSVTKPSNNNN